MKDFETKIAEKIKNMQQVVLQNTASLSDVVRAKVYSKFQNIKYKILQPSDFGARVGAKGSSAFFSAEDNAIYFLDYGQEEIQDVLLLHEMLHALSTDNYLNQKSLSNNVSGFRNIKLFTHKNSLVISSRYRSINEGATQYFAEKFLNIQSSTAYPFEVHIFSLLCRECGFEKLKNAYFSNQILGVKNIIREGFHLKDDYLIDNLFTFLDIFGVIFNNDDKYYKNLPLIKNCYITILQMKLNKLMAEYGDKYTKEDIIKNINVQYYLLTNSNLFMKSFLQSFFADLDRNKELFLNNNDKQKFGIDFVSKLSVLFAEGVLNQDIDFLENNLKNFKANALGILKQLCSENVYCKKDESGQYVKITNAKLIDIFLGYLHNQNDKIDLSDLSSNEKYQFISLALFNNYQNNEKRYCHFNSNDLVDYINCGLYDCDTFFEESAMEYIWEDIDKVDPSLFDVIQFQNTYSKIKAKKTSVEDELNTSIEEFK